MRKITDRIRTAMIVFALCVFVCDGTALAAGQIDTAQTGTLTIVSADGAQKQRIPGMSFRVYRIADVSADGALTLTPAAETYQVPTGEGSIGDWKQFAQTLALYYQRDGVTPAAQGTTDALAELTLRDLPAGLYMVCGDPLHVNGNVYTPSTTLVTVPQKNALDAWTYDVALTPELLLQEAPKDPVVRRVLKQWEGEMDGAQRPEKVSVQLLKNGVVYDTQVLTAEGGWSYQWDELNADDVWTVVEGEIVEDYSVRIVQQGITYVITNTYTPEIEPGPVPLSSGIATGGGAAETGNAGEDAARAPIVLGASRLEGDDTAMTAEAVRLPQTGMLWWPVSVIAVGGLLMFAGGWRCYRSERRG